MRIGGNSDKHFAGSKNHQIFHKMGKREEFKKYRTNEINGMIYRYFREVEN